MKSTKKWKRRNFTTISWAVISTLIYAVPCSAGYILVDGSNSPYELATEVSDYIDVAGSDTQIWPNGPGILQITPGGYASLGVNVNSGGNIIIYGSHEYSSTDTSVQIAESANAKLLTDSIDKIILTGDAEVDVDNMIIDVGISWDGTLTWEYQGIPYSLNITSASDITVEVLESPTPEELIALLINNVKNLNSKEGIINSLDAKLQNALAALEAANAGQRQDAVNKMDAFINAVEAQREKAITSEDADYLIASAQDIIDLLLAE